MHKGLDQWLESVDADIVCLQEIKANKEQIDVSVFNDLGYECFWHSAQKPGYGGTAILSRIMPEHVEYGAGMEAYDYEGRIIRADYGDVSVISVYMPSEVVERKDDIQNAIFIRFHVYRSYVQNDLN